MTENTKQEILNERQSHEKELARAQKSVADFARNRNNRWYPKYHIASDGGWLNDPNGLCYFGGRYHVFYQLNPYGTQWGDIHWGHVSSADMITWRREPVALAPSSEFSDDNDGIFSGSAIEGPDGNLMLFYTGARQINKPGEPVAHRQVQMLAESTNPQATAFKKSGTIIDLPHENIATLFRDPKVWKDGDEYLMVLAASSQEHRGQIWLYSSPDLRQWAFERVLFEDPDPNVYMLECPDFYPLTTPDGETKWVLCFSEMGMKPHGFMNRNVMNAGYVIGTWKRGEAFTPETEFRLFDDGHNYYAPQSFEGPDGRRIMYGWMSPFVKPISVEADGWAGQMTLPREVFIGTDGDVHTTPIQEIEQLYAKTQDLGSFALTENEEMQLCEDAQTVEIDMTIDLQKTTAERAGIKIHQTPDGSYTYIAYDDQMHRVVLDRRDIAYGDKGYRAAPLTDAEIGSGKLELKIFIDRGSVEVYINDGKQVLSSFSFASTGPRAVSLLSESGTMAVPFVQVHQMKSIGLE